jgi:hypothetical protein
LKKTANIHGLKLCGEFEVCEDCTMAKACLKNVNKVWTGSSVIPVERPYIDLRLMKEKSSEVAKS